MKYITGRHALNLPCSLGTPGDWHYYALDWRSPIMKDSETAFYGDFGLEWHTDVPGHAEPLLVANHLRACLDLLADGANPIARGMKENYLNKPALTPLVLRKVWELRGSDDWAAIDDFMVREYGMAWVCWKRKSSTSTEGAGVALWTPEEKLRHREVMEEVLRWLFQEEDRFVLKDSAALILCYQMNGFAENLMLDAEKRDILELMGELCRRNGYDCEEEKGTATVKRCVIRYGGRHPLKVEVFCDRFIDRKFNTVVIPVNRIPIRVYTIDGLAWRKVNVYLCHDAVRDVRDLCFITRKHLRQLTAPTVDCMVEAFWYKGVEYVEALVENNRLADNPRRDPLVDCDGLLEDWIKTEKMINRRQQLDQREERRRTTDSAGISADGRTS